MTETHMVSAPVSDLGTKRGLQLWIASVDAPDDAVVEVVKTKADAHIALSWQATR